MRRTHRSRIDPAIRLAARAAASAALSQVVAGEANAAGLERAAQLTAALPQGMMPGTPTWAYAEVLGALAMGVRWQPAVRAAESDADRYRRAAIARATDVETAGLEAAWPEGLREAAGVLAAVKSADDCVVAAAILRKTPLPVHLFGVFRDDDGKFRPGQAESPSIPPRAMLLLDIDGEPIDSPMLLRAGRVYRLGVQVLMEEWPSKTEAIEVDFLTVMESIRAGSAVLRPEGGTGSVMLEVLAEVSREAGAIELKPRVIIRRSDGSTVEPSVIGHRQLKVKTIREDVLRGFPVLPERLAEMEGEARVKLPALPEQEHADWLALLLSLLRFRKQVFEAGFIGKQQVRLESEFQEQVEWFLRADPSVGTRLRKGGWVAGGVPDLGLGNIHLELKVEPTATVTLERAHRYLSQPAQYGSAGDTPLSILCVLDASQKTLPAGVHAEYVGLVQPKLHGLEDPQYPSLVGVVIVQSNFPTPSTFSEMPARRRQRQR